MRTAMSEPSPSAPAQTSPGEDYAAKQKAGKQALATLLKPVSIWLTVGRVCAVISAITSIAPYLALTRIGDILLGAYQRGEAVDGPALHASVRLLVIAFLVQLSMYFIGLVITHLADVKLVGSLRRQMLERISRAPLSYFSESTSGAIRKAVQDDTRTLHMLVAHAPVDTTVAIISPLVLLTYAFIINWRLGLLAIATYPIYGFFQWVMMRDMGEKTTEMETKLANVSATGVEFAEGIEVVKGFGYTGQAHSRFASAAKEFADFYWAWCGPLLRGSAFSLAVVSVPVLLCINLGGGALMVQAGWVTTTQVLTCSLIALIVPVTIETLGTTAWAYQRAGHSALSLQQVLSAPQIDSPPADPHREDALAQHCAARTALDVTFAGVSYAYESDGTRIQALENVSLHLPAGSITALIGTSGSGKSTLATMLARFRDPDSGHISIGERDLRDFSEAELYRTVAFVLQDAHLLRMSIRDNIALAKLNASEEQIRSAAKAANILADIEALEHGFDTIVGEDTELSGGQRQRIVIARALLADAPILILDEATAATDPDCEAEIQDALSKLVIDRTVLVIAHHAESVIGADQICILERGQIAALGAAAEIASHPYWQRLNASASQQGDARG